MKPEYVSRWLEPSLVILLAPFLLFPSPSRSIFFFCLPLLFVLHFVSTGKFIEPSPLNLPLSLMLVMVAVSAYATYDVRVSLPKIAGVLLGAALYVAIVDSVRSARQAAIVIGLFILGGVAIACLALVGTQWLSKVPALATMTSRLPVWIKGLQGAEEGFQPNGVAGGLVLFIPLQVALAGWGLCPVRSGSERRRSVLFALVVVSLAITLGVVILTQSRAGWLGLSAALALLFAWRTTWGKWLGGTAAILAGALLLWFGPRAVGEYAMGSMGGAASIGSAVDGRLEVWNRALYAVADFPFTGMGMNTFRKVVHVLYPLFLTPPETDIAHAHNQLLQTALDLGIPGLVAYVSLLAATALMAFRLWRLHREDWIGCAAQGLVCGILAQQIYGITDAVALGAKVGVFFWVAVALTVSLYRISDAGTLGLSEIPSRQPEA